MNVSSARKPSYQSSLQSTTRIGAIVGAAFELGFAIFYWLSDYPPQVIYLLIASLLISLTGLVCVQFLNRPRLGAHLACLGLYISLLGPGLYTGGIDSSSMAWLILVPVVAALMMGKSGSIVWSLIGLFSLVGMYILNRVLMINLTIRPTESLDRLVDLVCISFATLLATWLNETIKQRTMNQLEKTQEKLENLSILDPLTNIYNRRYFFNRAQNELEHSRLIDSQASIILIDIDHFKHINDTYGHAVGDQVLCGAVSICTSVLRKCDILSRFGGEEFVVFLPQTQPAEAQIIAERLRKALEETPIETDFGPLNITISLGVTNASSKSSLSLQELIHQADTAMYKAKSNGRNQVIIWDKSLYPVVLTGRPN